MYMYITAGITLAIGIENEKFTLSANIDLHKTHFFFEFYIYIYRYTHWQYIFNDINKHNFARKRNNTAESGSMSLDTIFFFPSNSMESLAIIRN